MSYGIKKSGVNCSQSFLENKREFVTKYHVPTVCESASFSNKFAFRYYFYFSKLLCLHQFVNPNNIQPL